MPVTPEQAKAIQHTHGPILVVAGAGTGKTKVITERITSLIIDHAVPADSITALTFTEKATEEMRERLDLALPLGENTVWISTFHGFAADMISRYPYHLGHNPAARVVTPSEAVSILREQFSRFSFNLMLPPDNPVAFLRDYLGFYEELTESLVDVDEVTKEVSAQLAQATDEAEQERLARKLELLTNIPIVRAILTEANVDTYANLMAQAVQLLRTSKQALHNEQNRCQYLLVDEYQDTNPAQAELIAKLAGDRANVMVVGDDDQAIYGFRGATLENILTFTDTFPSAKQVTLVDNFRSTQQILDAAYAVVTQNNPYRLEAKLNLSKKLTSHVEGDTPVTLHHFDTTTAEAGWIADTIANQVAEGESAADFAVLARSHATLGNIEAALNSRGIAVRRSKQQSFYTQPAIAQALGFFTFLVNQQDSHTLFYLLNQKPFAISPLTLQPANSQARRLKKSLWRVLLEPTNDDATDDLTKAIAWLQHALSVCDHNKPAETLAYFVKQSGWEAMMVANDEAESLRHLNAFHQELVSYSRRHLRATIGQYLDHVTALIEAGEETQVIELEDALTPAVTLLTVHGSKGLEFPRVFIMGLSEQSFPPYPKTDPLLGGSASQEEKDEHYREERRLLYVAMTRAETELTLTYASRKPGGLQKKKMSRFLEPLNLPLVEHQEAPRVAMGTVTETKEYALTMPTSISISALETFEHSPAEYKNQYVYQLISEEASDASFGTTLHEVLRSAVTAQMADEQLDVEALYESLWVPYGYESELHQERWKAEGIDAVRNYLAEHRETPVLLEFPVRLTLEGITITGKVDRVNTVTGGGLSIIDYKTKRGRGTVSKQTLDKNLPLPFYALALTQSGRDIRSIALHYVMLGQVLEKPVTPELLDKTSEKLEQILAKLSHCYQTGVFPDDSSSVSVQ
jgi:DNA helicase-2/ATP-dependent DNA helicase PcrA